MSPPRSADLELLRASPLLRALPEADLAQLASRVRRARFAPGERVFRKGDSGGEMMVVVIGRVRIASVSRQGGEVLLNIMERGDVFGEMSLLDGKPRSADAVAARRTELLVLSRRDFLPVLLGSPQATTDLMTILCGRIRQTTAFVEDALLEGSETRLLRRIKALAEQYGRPDPDRGGIRIDHGLSQQQLGDSVGLTRVSVNRQLSAWRRRGLIHDGRGYLVVPDMAELEAASVRA